METYITIQGNLVADPVQRSTAGGATVVGLRIASSGRRFDKAAGEFRDSEPIFMNVSCWRGLGTNVLMTLRKGDSAVVHGRLQYRTYDDKQGVRHTSHEIDAIAVGPDLARCPADLRRPNRAAALDTARDAAPETATGAATEAAAPAASESVAA